MNQYNVINLDITSFILTAKREGISLREIPGKIIDAIKRDLASIAYDLPMDKSLEDCLTTCVDRSDGNSSFSLL